MTQYMATSTKNILERRENFFHWRGRWFPGLLDPEVNTMYDHPEDSFNQHLDMATALEEGKIIAVHGERVQEKSPLHALLADIAGHMIPGKTTYNFAGVHV